MAVDANLWSKIHYKNLIDRDEFIIIGEIKVTVKFKGKGNWDIALRQELLCKVQHCKGKNSYKYFYKMWQQWRQENLCTNVRLGTSRKKAGRKRFKGTESGVHVKPLSLTSASNIIVIFDGGKSTLLL